MRMRRRAAPKRTCIINSTMDCHEYNRLRQHYETALRRWAQIELSSSKSELVDARKRQALEIEQTALNERNAAYERMVFHEQSCPTCNHKHRGCKPTEPSALASPLDISWIAGKRGVDCDQSADSPL
jgi:hypothetical protein